MGQVATRTHDAGQGLPANQVGDRYKTMASYLNGPGVIKQLANALPRHITPERMVRISLGCFRRNPKLLLCSPESFAAALIECAEYGLEPNGRDVHLVPFRNNKKECYEITVIVDYKGYIKLFYRSGMVQNVMAAAVRQRDHFKYRYGSGSFIEHEPADVEDRGPLTHAWAMVEIKGGGCPFVVLNRSQVMKHRKKSKGAEDPDSPWNTDEDDMWAKTAVRVLRKFVPMSAEIERVFDAEDERGDVFDGAAVLGRVSEAAEEEPKAVGKTERLAQAIQDQAKPPPTANAEPPTEASATQKPQEQPRRPVVEYLDLAASAKTVRDFDRLDTYFFGPESEIQMTEEERVEIKRMITEGREAALKKAPKSGGQQNLA
jgi:recombination protein RecT